MTMNECFKCRSSDADRKCMDCMQLYCKKCFAAEHTGNSRSYHVSKDLKTNAFIKDVNFRKSESIDDNELPSTDDLFPGMDKSIDLKNDKTDFNSIYTSISGERRPLFETNVITNYDSVDHLASELDVDNCVKLNIVTVIGKPKSGSECLTNTLLLKDTSYKFPNYAESSLLCRMACNRDETLLILRTESMYKGIAGKTNDQDNLLRLLLSLSDVIIFTQTAPDREEDSRSSIKRDFLRIHDIMHFCKKEYQSNFSKIIKKEPQKLAPGLIYLVQSNFQSKENLSESVVDATGRSALFESFSKVLRFDGEDDKIFQYGLDQILHDLSEYRVKHSLQDIFSCIKDNKEAIIRNDTDPFLPIVPNIWFRCRQLCSICDSMCMGLFGHQGVHDNEFSCNETEENKIYFCKKCIKEDSPTKTCPLVFKAKGKEENFLKSAAWYTFRGKVIECDKHGIINDNNWFYTYYEDTVVKKCIHKWPGSNLISQNVYPMSQMVMDKFTAYSKPIHKVISDSADTITDTFIIPVTWEKTSSAIECHCCRRSFTSSMSKHHCRNCTFVVCKPCFNYDQFQGLCSTCVESKVPKSTSEDPTGLKIVNSVKSPINMLTTFVKKTVTSINRPDYWEDDNNVVYCFKCNQKFDEEMKPIHHCRACGRCVCDECSSQSRTVEWRYLYEPSRVCDKCITTEHWKKTP